VNLRGPTILAYEMKPLKFSVDILAFDTVQLKNREYVCTVDLLKLIGVVRFVNGIHLPPSPLNQSLNHGIVICSFSFFRF